MVVRDHNLIYVMEYVAGIQKTYYPGRIPSRGAGSRTRYLSLYHIYRSVIPGCFKSNSSFIKFDNNYDCVNLISEF